MTVKELKERLNHFPDNLEIFFGEYYTFDKVDGLEIYALYDCHLEHKEKCRSARSGLSCSNSIVENILIIHRD